MKTRHYPTLPNRQPAICCFGLSLYQLHQREARAARRFEAATRQLPANLTEEERQAEIINAAEAILWYTDFPAGLKLLVCDNQLYRLTADLPSQLEEANGGEPLDFWDYAYVADLLRELLLAYGLGPADELLLQRALAWVEEKGERYHHYGLAQ